jgi:hypothetical protein
MTIQDDYKLIKYLNESYVNFAKMINSFEMFKRLDKLKQNLLDINSRWDNLHSEIAIKIKLVRRVRYNSRKVFILFLLLVFIFVDKTTGELVRIAQREMVHLAQRNQLVDI